MSYCVNCGVELDDSMKKCALCNTPVVHPGRDMDSRHEEPFPEKIGMVERVKRTDVAIVFTMFVLATAVTCFALNALVFTGFRWSLAVIGVCVILWVGVVPPLLWKRSMYMSLILDGLSVSLYIYMLAHMVGSYRWCFELGLPIVGYVTLVALLLTIAVRKLPKSFLTITLYFNLAIGLLCGGLECLIDYYIAKSVSLGWSAVVMTICAIFAISIITMLSRRRVRSAVRRRLHF